MIRYLIRNKILWYVLVAMIILGYTTGTAMGNNIDSYITTFYQRPIYYSLMIVNLFFDYILFKNYFKASFICRYKDILSLLKQNIIIELCLSILIFLALHIGIAINKIDLLIQIYPTIIKLFLNYMIVTMLIVGIIKMINIKINNHIFSIILFIGLIASIDGGMELYEYMSGKTCNFIIQFIYIIPYIYKIYMIVDICLLLLALLLIVAATYQMSRKDYAIKRS